MHNRRTCWTIPTHRIRAANSPVDVGKGARSERSWLTSRASASPRDGPDPFSLRGGVRRILGNEHSPRPALQARLDRRGLHRCPPREFLVPNYLITDTAFHGGAARKYDGDDEAHARFDGWVARRWDAAVRARFFKLLETLGREFDGRVEAIVIPETAIRSEERRVGS